MKIKFFDLLGRGVRGLKRFRLILQLAKTLNDGNKARNHFYHIPENYNCEDLNNWIMKGERYFTEFYKKMEAASN